MVLRGFGYSCVCEGERRRTAGEERMPRLKLVVVAAAVALALAALVPGAASAWAPAAQATIHPGSRP
jgi:hypothetical protein